MSDAVQVSSQSQVHVTQLYEENTNKRPVLTSQPNGLAPLSSSRPGLPLPDRQTSAAEPAHHCRQTSAASNKSADSKPKPNPMSPEQAMKQFMSKMSSFEHHEVFSYPEGERPSFYSLRWWFCLDVSESLITDHHELSPQCTLLARMRRRDRGSSVEQTTGATMMIRGPTFTYHMTRSPIATKS